MRRNLTKFFISIMLVVCMIVSGVGCSKEKQTHVDDTTLKPTINNDTTQETDYGKGRYVEKIYTLPESANIFLSVLSDKNSEKVPDQITFTSWYNNYSYDEEKEEWVTHETDWLDHNVVTRFITIGEDGKEYYINEELQEDNTLLRFLYVKEGDTFQNISIPALDEKMNIKINGEFEPLCNYLITKDGGVILGFTDHIDYIKKDGKLYELTDIVGAGTIIVDNKLYALDTSLEDLYVYDLSNWTLADSIPTNDLFLQNQSYYRCTAMTKDSDGNIYLQSSKGIFRLSKNATSFTLLIDASLNYIGSGNELPWCLSIDENGKFINIRSNLDVTVWTLYTYEYDPNISTIPEKELTIYSYYDLPEIHAAIPEYQNKYPDVFVNYIVQSDGSDESVTVNDVLKNLNSQLLAGEGPDIIYLDEFNFRDFADRGVLVDITEPIENNSDIFESIKHTFVKDGKIYAIPSRVQIPVFTGSTQAFEFTKSLQELTDYTRNSDTSVFAGVSEWDIIMYFYNCYRNELFNEDGSVNPDMIKAMIENIKIISDNSVLVNNSSESNSIFNVKTGYSSLGIGRIYNGFSLQVVLEGLNYTNTTMTTINNCYVPKNIFSINNNSKMKQEALDFMQIILSDKIQSKDCISGVSVKKTTVPNQSVYENPMNRRGFTMSIFTEFGQTDTEIPWATKEQAQSYVPLYDELTNPYIYDQALDMTIIQGIYQYYYGECTMDEIMTNITSFLNIYTTE